MHQALSKSVPFLSKSGSFLASRERKKKKEEKRENKTNPRAISSITREIIRPRPIPAIVAAEKSVRSTLRPRSTTVSRVSIKPGISLSDIFPNIFVQSHEKKNSAEIDAGLFAEALRRIKSASPALKAEEDPAAPRETNRK